MQSPLEYHRPANLAHALALLARPAPLTRPLAGGTHYRRGLPPVEAVVDLADLGLNAIQADEARLTLGATATLAELEACELLPPALRRAAHREAPYNLRNAATLGGLLACRDSGPLLVCLLALAAQVHLQPDGRRLPLADFLAAPPTGLITALSFDLGRSLAWDEVCRTPSDAPILCLAASAASGPVLCAAGGAGQPLAAFTDPAQAPLWQDDLRASAEYRRAMLPVLLERVLADLKASVS